MKDEFIELYTAVYKDLYRYALYVLGNSGGRKVRFVMPAANAHSQIIVYNP